MSSYDFRKKRINPHFCISIKVKALLYMYFYDDAHFAVHAFVARLQFNNFYL